MAGFIMVFCTCGSEAEALELANAVVQKRQAACVNVLRGVQSVYRWNDELQSASECLLLAKTTEDRFPALQSTLLDLHTYENPEIVAVPIAAGAQSYLSWIRASV